MDKIGHHQSDLDKKHFSNALLRARSEYLSSSAADKQQGYIDINYLYQFMPDVYRTGQHDINGEIHDYE